MSAWSAASLRRARMPPCTLGCSVFTRPPSISVAPVKSWTCFTFTPSRASIAAVPPVDRISIPSPARPRANSTRPVLSETLINARATVITRLHTTAPRASARGTPAEGRRRIGQVERAGGANVRIRSTRPRGARRRPTRLVYCGGAKPHLPVRQRLVVLVVPGRQRLVVGDHPQLRQTAHLQLAHPLPGEIHDHADLFQRDAGPVRDVESAGLRELPQLLVGKVHLHRPGARVDVHVEVVLAGDVRAGPLAFGAVAPVLRPAGVQLRHQRLQLGIESAGRRLLQRREKLVERSLHAVELPAEEDERVPDVLERHPLVHQRLDDVDAPDRARRIETLRAAMLSLLADAPAAREQSELDVLAEGGLRELHAARREEVDDLDSGDPLRVLFLESVEVVAFALRHRHPAQGAAPSDAAPPAML